MKYKERGNESEERIRRRKVISTGVVIRLKGEGRIMIR
jgi:hypothetical protein